MEEFLRHLRFQRNRSPHTVAAYGSDLELFSEFLSQKGRTLGSASALEIRMWVVSQIESGAEASSVRRRLSSLRAFYRYMLSTGQIEKDPSLTIRSPKQRKRLPSVVAEGELTALLDSGVFPETYEGRRDRCAIELLYRTGMRRSELVGLSWKDVEANQGEIRVLGKRSKVRLIPIDAQMHDLLKDLRARPDRPEGLDSNDAVFLNSSGHRMSPALVYSIVRHYLSFTHSEKRSPHVLRHSFATHMLSAGADLQEIRDLLGHSGLAATQVYTQTSIERLKAVFNRAHPRADNNPES